MKRVQKIPGANRQVQEQLIEESAAATASGQLPTLRLITDLVKPQIQMTECNAGESKTVKKNRHTEKIPINQARNEVDRSRKTAKRPIQASAKKTRQYPPWAEKPRSERPRSSEPGCL